MPNFDKNIVVVASFLTAITIGMGAFGAHGLKNLVDASALNTFETGIRYQMYHCLALLLLGLAPLVPIKIKKTVFWFFVFGMLFFSGSIYLLALNSILPFDATKIGFITPIGGLLFILGWIWFAVKMLTLKKQ
ncbi:DUF423 domain-containing protein [Vitellibacter sp. q18]|jgi:uncharacterized membrane protein YgdD (TMEM256/DUF423 family)|nr:DUF423 domain-containing protein [Aequorivita lutea]